MNSRKGKAIILSKNSSALFIYAGALNNLGFYTLNLCSQVSEVLDLLALGTRFEYLVYDDLAGDVDTYCLQAINQYRAIASIIAIADVNSQQRKSLFLWARDHKVPLQGVLQKPLRQGELRELIEVNWAEF